MRFVRACVMCSGSVSKLNTFHDDKELVKVNYQVVKEVLSELENFKK